MKWPSTAVLIHPRSSLGVHALSSQDAFSFTCRVEELVQTLHSGRRNTLACKGDPLCPSPNMGQVAHLRDEVALHLKAADLSREQDRARKWFDTRFQPHPTKSK